MSISKATTKKIEAFSKEQAKYYLKEAEQNYFNKQEGDGCFIKSKIIKGVFKKKSSKQTILEAENDLQIYMTDYMDELMGNGMSEQEAFEQAKEEFRFSSASTFSKDLTQKIISYINNIDIDRYLFIGLLYSAFFFLGMMLGTLIGFFVGGGKAGFVSGGWVDMVIGCVAGIFSGLSLGLIAHAIVIAKNK